ncbi:formylglycine-generating enzyme required for sulfatase activity [Azospirillum lipoferum]|nr:MULTISPECIES: SUMF1/EgtB/PvdO family nonheme iron enzyme [Azospirillum]MCP1611898.1 formylglycine-generating enzyme required for sulfatase activity [Azospirillum lipoferum]MDW5533343.1 SUMF1/EgtB/PvdO family nonheme iron enzyme [Azospirillum sp. NL1]
MVGPVGPCRTMFAALLLLVLVVVAPWAHAAGPAGGSQPGSQPGGQPSGAAESRLALVIGVSNYRNAPELVNPRNDAKAIGEALRALNFTVDEQYDLDARGFATALRQFGLKASQADVAVIFYAGHGIQVNGVNYLLPADAQLERERDLVYEAIPLNLPMGELAGARKLGILILDACRNNPFVDRLTRSGSNRNQAHPGFGSVDDTPSDTLVAMATRADQLAEDGTGDHSPFSAALLQHLQTPGLELSLFFRNVRDTVKQATNGRQEPFVYGSLGATPFYFNPRPPNRPPVLGELRALTVLDRAGAEPLAAGKPTDPDDDQMYARVTGLPRGGTVRVGERSVLIGDYLTVDQLAATSFKPDGSFRGDAGAFEFLVADGRGGMTTGAIPVTIKPSNQPPAVVPERKLRVAGNPMGIDAPSDPDGDPLTITITGVPERGSVHNGAAVVKPGDRLTVQTLTALTFDPEAAAPGPAGSLHYSVDDGRGGAATASVSVDIAAPGTAPVAELEDSLWKKIQGSREPGDYQAFLQLFGSGSYAPMARRQLEALKVVSKPAEPPPKAEAKPEAAMGPGLEPAEPGRYTVAADGTLRATPANNGARVGRVARGSAVQVLGRVPEGGWYRIALEDGTQGFVAAALLKHEAPPAPAPPPTPPTTPPTPAPSQAATPPPAEPQVAATAPPVPGNGGARNHGTGNSFQDCPTCPVLVRVPAGSFMMGNDKGDASERPVHRVTIAKPFALGMYEVTVGEWRACIQEGGCTDMPRMANPTDGTPVHNLHWQDAQAYVSWLSRKTGQRYRLPSEAEWEFAARAGTTTPYWWGAEEGNHADCDDCGGPHEHLTPAAAGSYKANPLGLHDMNGGVAEWVADCWNKNYQGAPADGSAWTQGNCRKRVLRGGSWRDKLEAISGTMRNSYDIDVRYLTNGFRVAREVN